MASLYQRLIAGVALGLALVGGAANTIAHPLSKYYFKKAEIKYQENVGPIVAPHRIISMASGDFNGDGLDDLVVLSTFDGSVKILQNLGRGKFEYAETIGSIGPRREALYPIVVGDFNGDGKLDIAVIDNDGKILVYFNNTKQVGNIKPLNK